MEKQYKKISDKEIEEITTTSRKIDREFVERELEAIKENIVELQKQKEEFEILLKMFK